MRQTILISRLLFWLQLKAAAPACSYFPSLTLPMIAQPVTFVWSQSLRWTIASALKDLILTVGALTKSGKMECDSRYNGGNFVRKLTFFCWLVHMTDIFPPLGFSLHPNNHCDIPGKIREIEYCGTLNPNQHRPQGGWRLFEMNIDNRWRKRRCSRIGMGQSTMNLSVCC